MAKQLGNDVVNQQARDSPRALDANSGRCGDPRSCVELSAEDHRFLEQGAARLIAEYDYLAEPDRWVRQAQLRSAGLSDELRGALLDFKRGRQNSGFLLVRGVPTGEVPPTPATAQNALASTLLATAAISILVAPLGDQISYKPELDGQLLQSILPQKDAETAQRSVGSKVYLEDHIEMAFTDQRPDYVVLCCVRADHDGIAGTAVASVDHILPLLDSETVQTLRKPWFKTAVDQSFLIGWGLIDDIWVEPIAVLSGSKERPRVQVDFGETTALNSRAQAALDRLREVVSEVRQPIRLSAGDLIVIDNISALHGRTPFTPRYDGRDRWLVRTFITRDLRRSLHVRPGDTRLIDPDYRTLLSIR